MFMRKFLLTVYVVLMVAIVFSLSGCGDGNGSLTGSNRSPIQNAAQVAVIESPVFEKGNSYKIYKGSVLQGMDRAMYYVAPEGDNDNKTTLNLGFAEELGNETLVFVKYTTNQVVFAYDPSGSGYKTSGTVEMTDSGKQMKYNGLTFDAASFFTAMNVDTSSAKVIQLNGDSATFEGSDVPTYNYVWHADPNHRDEYYTEGLNGTDELTEAQVLEAIGDRTVYIAHDIRYMPDTLDFSYTTTKDGETEYAAHYSDEVAAAVYAELGEGFAGPYVFATLPSSNGMGGPGGGGFPGGTSRDFTPGGMSGDFGPGGMSRDFNPRDRISASASNSEIAAYSTMTHSASDAYDNPVLHITKPGVYTLQGTWDGQIWIDAGDEDDPEAVVTVILNGVTVTCGVAPAIVFHDLYECGSDDEDVVAASSMDLGADLLDNAGAKVIIADDTTNTFTGANVYRMLKAQKKNDSVTKIDGTDVSQQKKRYKMDAAFYSFVSMAIGGGEKANGVLNIKSTTFEGLDAELHMTVESGTISVYGVDDAINVNEDDVSTFTMLDGTLNITSETGDGIDSNGYVVILGGTLNITAGNQKQNSAGEAGIDAESGTYIDSSATYNWTAYSGSGGGDQPSVPGGDGSTSGDTNPEQPQSTDIQPVESQDVSPGDDGGNSGTTNPDTNILVPDAQGMYSIATSAGITRFNMDASDSSTVEDTDTSPREIEISGNIFRLTHTINTFSGIIEE